MVTLRTRSITIVHQKRGNNLILEEGTLSKGYSCVAIITVIIHKEQQHTLYTRLTHLYTNIHHLEQRKRHITFRGVSGRRKEDESGVDMMIITTMSY